MQCRISLLHTRLPADEKRIAVCGLPQYDIERILTGQFAEEERIREAEFPPSEQAGERGRPG